MRRTARVAAALLTGVLAVGCTAAPREPELPGPPPPPESPALTAVPSIPSSIPPPTTQAPITGSADPRAVPGADGLSGRATGGMVLAIAGLGELRSAVSGECVPSAGGTTLRVNSPEGTRVEIRLGESPAVAVTDSGLDFRATLLPGDYAVAAPRLTVATTFQPVGDDNPGGRLDLDLTCT